MSSKLYVGQCAYHRGKMVEDLRIVQLNNNGGWDRPEAICGDCRKALKGVFRYAPKTCSSLLGLISNA